MYIRAKRYFHLYHLLHLEVKAPSESLWNLRDLKSEFWRFELVELGWTQNLSDLCITSVFQLVFCISQKHKYSHQCDNVVGITLELRLFKFTVSKTASLKFCLTRVILLAMWCSVSATAGCSVWSSAWHSGMKYSKGDKVISALVYCLNSVPVFIRQRTVVKKQGGKKDI